MAMITRRQNAYQIINIVNCLKKKGTNVDSVKEHKKNS